MFSKIIRKISNDVDAFFQNSLILDISSYEFFDEALLNALTSLKKNNSMNGSNGYIEKSNLIKTSLFDNKIYPIVPLYLTNFCNQTCLYCNYSRFNTKIKRLRLGKEELIKELECLVVNKGYKSIELVYATDPHISIDEIIEHISLTKEFLLNHNGKYVGINAQSFSTRDYILFKDAGLDFVVLWQETYDEERYITLHPNDREKSDFMNRLDTYEGIYEAGIDYVGMGVLSGIQKDFVKDWALLMIHESYLKWKYGKKVSILGIPRLKGKSEINYLPQIEYSIPNDVQFLELLAIHNIYSPETLPFVNTREEWDLCAQIARGGGCLFTFNCSTFPGGYTHNEETHQFPTYNLEIEKYYNKAMEINLFPKFDWSFIK